VDISIALLLQFLYVLAAKLCFTVGTCDSNFRLTALVDCGVVNPIKSPPTKGIIVP